MNALNAQVHAAVDTKDPHRYKTVFRLSLPLLPWCCRRPGCRHQGVSWDTFDVVRIPCFSCGAPAAQMALLQPLLLQLATSETCAAVMGDHRSAERPARRKGGSSFSRVHWSRAAQAGLMSVLGSVSCTEALEGEFLPPCVSGVRLWDRAQSQDGARVPDRR